MKYRLILFVTAGLIAGCSSQPKQEPPVPVSDIVEMDGKWVVGLADAKLGAKHLSPPNADDKAYVRQLPRGVVQKCIAFLDRGGSIKPIPHAARRTGSYILVALEYKGGPSASDRCVVYSTEGKRVVGEFVWYAQH
jgi:hypothetical protein